MTKQALTRPRLTLGDQTYDVDRLTSSLGFLTRVIQVQIREFIRANEPLAVSPAVYAVLALIGANPGIRQVHVAQILAIHESNLATVVKGLLTADLIKRSLSAARKRTTGLKLSKLGQSTLANVAARIVNIDRVYTSSLSEPEYQQLTSLLTRVFETGLLAGLA